MRKLSLMALAVSGVIFAPVAHAARLIEYYVGGNEHTCSAIDSTGTKIIAGAFGHFDRQKGGTLKYYCWITGLPPIAEAAATDNNQYPIPCAYFDQTLTSPEYTGSEWHSKQFLNGSILLECTLTKKEKP